MKNEVRNNDTTTKNLNSSQNYNKDKNIYFMYYIAGVIVLAVFLNLAVNIESTEEYYEKYYVLEDYINNLEYIDENQDSDDWEYMNNNEENSEESNDNLNEDDSEIDNNIDDEY